MAVKYVKDFDFPAAGGFHKSKMPSRAMPNAPARGAARMESKPKMGKGQGYAEGGKVQKFVRGGPTSGGPTSRRYPGQGRKPYNPYTDMRIPIPYIDDEVYRQRNRIFKDGGEVPGREMDKLPAKKAPGRKKDLAPSKPERGQYQGYAKGGKVQKFARGGTPMPPGSKAFLGRMPGPKDYTQISNPLSRIGIGPSVINIPKGASDQAQRLSAVNKGQMYNFFTGQPNPEYDPAYDPTINREEIQYRRGGKVSKVMREYKAGKLHSGSKKGPVVKNPKQAIAIALSEARKAGAKIPKKAEGGMMSKGPSTRRSSESDRAQSRMEFAEKYAPGLSIDMPGRRVRKK